MGVWTRRQRFQHIPLPEANAPKDHPTVLWVARPADSAGPPFLAVGGSGEEMLWGNFENTTQVRFELYSRTQLTSSTATPDYAVIDPQGMRQVLDAQFVSTAEGLSCFVVSKLVPFSIGTKYRFLSIRPGNTTNLAGTFTASARDQLHLDSNDSDTYAK